MMWPKPIPPPSNTCAKEILDFDFKVIAFLIFKSFWVCLSFSQKQCNYRKYSFNNPFYSNAALFKNKKAPHPRVRLLFSKNITSFSLFYRL
jgi:hypothetical protein